jgi:hypothetical protein
LDVLGAAVVKRATSQHSILVNDQGDSCANDLVLDSRGHRGLVPAIKPVDLLTDRTQDQRRAATAHHPLLEPTVDDARGGQSAGWPAHLGESPLNVLVGNAQARADDHAQSQ